MYNMTEAGKIFEKTIIYLQKIPYGSMIAAMLADSERCWCLFYEQGGDYKVFGDGEEINFESLQEWMPDEIEKSIETLSKIFEGNEEALEDLEWFKDWASTARDTLLQGREEEEE